MTGPDAQAPPHEPGALLRVADGVELHVQVSGEGPPVLLLHGVGCCADDWTGAARQFRARARRRLRIPASRIRVDAVDVGRHR